MIYVIMGPTCSGKTEVANYLIDKLNCCAINFDAFQIYKDMNVGTAKIEKSDPHYTRYKLLDIRTPEQTFSVMEYQSLCRDAINEELKTNKNVVLVGGTGLYAKAALYDYVFNVEKEIDNTELEKLSNEELWETLKTLDENESKKIHVNNRKRLIRAINLINSSDKNKTELLSQQSHDLIYKNVKFIFLNPNREDLYHNINNRVIDMVNNKGLIDEVRELLNKYQLSLTASQGIGYKEVIEYLNGKLTLQECIALIQKRTRNYAKRQVTFFKNQFKYEEYISKEDAIKALSED